MFRHKPSTEAEQMHRADVKLAAQRVELLGAAHAAESLLRQAQARRAPTAEIRRLAEALDAALSAAMLAAYAAQRVEIGPRGYDDRIYRRKARATPRVHALTAEAERLLTLRETHRLNGIPAVTFGWRPIPEPIAALRMSGRLSMTSSSPSPHDNWRPGDPLTQIENEMCAKTAVGDPLYRAGGPFKHVTMGNWGPDRTVRAEVLRYLLVEDDWQVHARGVRLIGIKISGPLDLEGTTLRCSLRLENCSLSSSLPVNVENASVSLLAITDCRLAGLFGDTLTVSKDLDLSESTFTSQVRLVDADITGQFNCSKAQLTAGPDDGGYALLADGMKVSGDVSFEQVTATGGAVKLLGAIIGGQLKCRGAQLNGVDEHNHALGADGIKVAGDVNLGQDAYPESTETKVGGDVSPNQDFTAAGAVRLPGADIRGQLSCRGAQLTGADWGRQCVAPRWDDGRRQRVPRQGIHRDWHRPAIRLGHCGLAAAHASETV